MFIYNKTFAGWWQRFGDVEAGEKYCVKTQPERLNGVVFDGIVLSHKTV